MGLFGTSSEEEGLPLGAYTAIVGVFGAGLAAGLMPASRRGRVRAQVGVGDLIVLGLATHKLSRLIAKDSVTRPFRAPFTRYTGESQLNELAEEPRGHGLQQAIGQLLFCPQCVGQWVAAGFSIGLLRAPKMTRAIAGVYAIHAVSDFLHAAYGAVLERTS